MGPRLLPTERNEMKVKWYQRKKGQHESCALPGYCAANSGNSLPTFLDNLSDPRETSGPTGCPETSVRNYHYSLRKSPQESSSHLLPGRSFKSRIEQASSTYGLRFVKEPSRRILQFVQQPSRRILRFVQQPSRRILMFCF
jgi:hypothetical protein